jgi:tRNA (adenine22-N1)-methyltransferase
VDNRLNQINISDRLIKIADLIPKCDAFADIGTDHGYLAIYAIQNKIAKRVIASDISKKPLEQAKRQIEESLLESEISTRLGPGLVPIRDNEVEGIVIAGMGGSNIYTILEDDKEKSKNLGFLVLQPQNNSHYVRDWLINNGYKIFKEELVKENDIIYQIIQAKPGKDKKYDKVELEFGLIENVVNDKLLKDLIEDKLIKYNKIILEMNNSDNNDIINRKKLFEEKAKLLKNYLAKI